MATSDAPVMSAALYRTGLVTGSVDVPVAVPEGSGESIVMTSIFSAIIMLVAAFYY